MRVFGIVDGDWAPRLKVLQRDHREPRLIVDEDPLKRARWLRAVLRKSRH